MHEAFHGGQQLAGRTQIGDEGVGRRRLDYCRGEDGLMLSIVHGLEEN